MPFFPSEGCERGAHSPPHCLRPDRPASKLLLLEQQYAAIPTRRPFPHASHCAHIHHRPGAQSLAAACPLASAPAFLPLPAHNSTTAPAPPNTAPADYYCRSAPATHVDVEWATHTSGGSPVVDPQRPTPAVLDCEALSLRAHAMAQVLSSRPEGSPFHTPMRSPSSSSLFTDSYSLRRNQNSLPDLRIHSPSSSRTSSLRSTPSSSLSLDTRSDESSSEDDSLSFPNYASASRYRKPIASFDLETTNLAPASASLPRSPSPTPVDAFSSDTPLTTPDPLPMSEDDTAVRKEPSHHVDYLSYVWREEDIWSSWRHIVEHRKVYGERSRLENASWRTWAKSQFKLRTVSPDTLNW
jgi:hypothetical protein